MTAVRCAREIFLSPDLNLPDFGELGTRGPRLVWRYCLETAGGSKGRGCHPGIVQQCMNRSARANVQSDTHCALKEWPGVRARLRFIHPPSAVRFRAEGHAVQQGYMAHSAAAFGRYAAALTRVLCLRVNALSIQPRTNCKYTVGCSTTANTLRNCIKQFSGFSDVRL